ncbi:hypothetical protein C0033_12845 [Clostridium sp. chh4-2]|nr:hypothetical protein C0033_23195 [Clostridium sp. chh4-2]PNV61769.1 hypothetical protein C0033_12845 [Clostridium sp. chh4-2]
MVATTTTPFYYNLSRFNRQDEKWARSFFAVLKNEIEQDVKAEMLNILLFNLVKLWGSRKYESCSVPLK